ncbi:pyruvate carboxylase [Bradyrhizobium sp. WYCCWR 13022]|uniref:pyruvate carboxylase n=1 Tax=unclassified Bradyrhizobium TaxID=2631580 RepID=UPI00263A69B1|nr:pyruvate carboxylase [Bradyrhizobium sp. WYCCWR 13022]MDN4984306.1 pyruvate carboxylase [Bradyrhizobium sp. WYCCWR 13022]
MSNIKRILVANRGEIAIRVFRAASEMGIATVAIYAEEDTLSLHRFKADEAYQVGRGARGELQLGPIEAYLSIDEVVRVAVSAKVDAIHPGYGFLSESPEFAEACAAAGIIFIGPTPLTMRTLGNKVAARNLAQSQGVPVMPASPPLPYDNDAILQIAAEVGYPVMLKASWGGGGRGMRPIEDEAALLEAVASARREAKSTFGKDEVYLEKLVRRARHVEVQLLGDTHGRQMHLFERDCSIQRRNQKIVERAPAPYLEGDSRDALCQFALRIGAATNYVGAGTVEFLMDADTGAFYFIEVNPRIQVEHTVTEQITGLDIVKAQIRIAEGGRLGFIEETGIPPQEEIRMNGHALQCRITTENPENHFIPDYGRIQAYRGAFGLGIRVDGGTAYTGAVVSRHYDPLLEKVTAWAPSSKEVIARMGRALREYRIRGVATNLTFLQTVLVHPTFVSCQYSTRFVDETPELFAAIERRDRATKLLSYIGQITVNGHPETRDRPKPVLRVRDMPVPRFEQHQSYAPQEGTRVLLDSLGPKAFAEWMRSQRTVLITDTTMRDAHQSLLATRMRTRDIATISEAYAVGLPQLFSLECWGGATFDVAMRFLNEDPWERLALIRQAAPNILTQMLVRGANGVGYTNYPDNVVRHFIGQAASAGMDVFRIFDCLNWVENMRVSIDAVLESNRLAEGAICYTGDILDSSREKYSLSYYIGLAKELEAAGCHILGIKDMAGVLKPQAARVLVKALKEEVGLPIHLHTHDTSGLGGATLLAAVDAGVDAIDAAMDAFSGATSQPCLGSLVEALRHTDRDSGLSADAVRRISHYWETTRNQYSAFESAQAVAASEVYLHEMPGGQYTNLKEQARSLGLDQKWHEIASTYRTVNEMLGDIVKVTPSSKVVGDMALLMVSQGLSRQDVEDPEKELSFPASVVDMLRGNLGQPPGGWPKTLQLKALKGETPIVCRPGALLPDADLARERSEAERLCGRPISEHEFVSYLMYPKIFLEYVDSTRRYGPVSVLPTSVFFYGMRPNEECSIEIEHGKRLQIRLLTIGETDQDGETQVFFELNGQQRIVKVRNHAAGANRVARRQADASDQKQVAAPMPGSISNIAVTVGQSVKARDVLFSIEAMKMETVLHAQEDGIISEILVQVGQQVDAKDLLAVIA